MQSQTNSLPRTATGATVTTGYVQVVKTPCKTCGRCPDCGQPSQPQFVPYQPYWYVPTYQPHYSPFTVTSSNL